MGDGRGKARGERRAKHRADRGVAHRADKEKAKGGLKARGEKRGDGRWETGEVRSNRNRRGRPPCLSEDIRREWGRGQREQRKNERVAKGMGRLSESRITQIRGLKAD